MEVARLEANYTVNVSDLEKKSAQADARLKQTASQAKQTERAILNAFKGPRASINDPFGKLKADFGARSARLRADLSDIRVRTAALKTPLRQLELQAANTGLALRRDLDGALGILSPRLASVLGAVGPLTAGILGLGAVIAGGAGLLALAKHAADAGDEIFDLTQKVNFSAESISTLKNEGQLAGVEFGTISSSLGIFNKNLEAVNQGDKELSRTFKALKIDIRDNETALRSAFRALMAVEDGGQQSALAMKIFGKSGKEVLGIIKSMNGDIDAATEKFRAMGTLITTESARAANEFSDKLTSLQQKFDAVARSVGERFMPTISSAMDQVNAALDKNRASAQNWATDLVAIVEFAARQIGHILKGLSLVIEGFRKTFGAGSLFERMGQGGTVNVQSAMPGLSNRLNRPNLSTPGQRWEDEGEFAIPFGRPPADKPAGRIKIPDGGSGGGAKTQIDILENLRSTLIGLNTEWRKWDVALLDSATSSALAAQKQTLLDNVMSSLSSKTKLTISGIRDIDEALDKAVSSLPKKLQAAAQALIQESLAQFKSNEQRRIAGEINKEAERLTQNWRLEIDNSRSGADEFTKAIQGLEKAYSKYGLALEPTTRAELEHLAAQQRLLRVTRERLTVLNQMRQRVVGEDVLRDLGQGSVAFRGEASRDRIATVGETVLREREQMRIQEMREIAEDLGSIFGDAFDSIRDGWESLWQDMAQVARSISRQFIQDLFTGMFSRAFNVPFQSQSGGIVGSWINRIFGGGAPSITDLGGNSTFMPGGTGAIRPRIAGARATGGPVEAGRLYQINERGTEYFRPTIGGQIIPLGQEQSNSGVSRLYLVDDERAAFERGATRREIAKVNKQIRKVGKLVPGF